MFKTLASSLLWRGILAIVIGLVSIVWPGITVGAFVILFAVYCILLAVIDAARGFASHRAGSVAWYLLLAVLSLLAGVIAIFLPGVTALVLTLWIAAWAVITGIVQVAMAFVRGETAGERALWAVTGLISLVFGIVIAVHPGNGAVALATVFGFFALIYGIGDVVMSVQVRGLGKERS
ncbi:HdeD family acid-resistance protein [Fodinicola acaciae]|uniref:HdeD family acid-resistance protein n=1 Tax=Fodinicola acaciae TaxID=2681555 RepID=UPI0013D18CEF|nr:DUF308 domain-containing protein [Fodinicola acaciae]